MIFKIEFITVAYRNIECKRFTVQFTGVHFTSRKGTDRSGSPSGIQTSRLGWCWLRLAGIHLRSVSLDKYGILKGIARYGRGVSRKTRPLLSVSRQPPVVILVFEPASKEGMKMCSFCPRFAVCAVCGNCGSHAVLLFSWVYSRMCGGRTCHFPLVLKEMSIRREGDTSKQARSRAVSCSTPARNKGTAVRRHVSQGSSLRGLGRSCACSKTITRLAFGNCSFFIAQFFTMAFCLSRFFAFLLLGGEHPNVS